MTKVKDAIKMLQEYLNPNESVVIDWWDKSLFEDMHNKVIDDKDWEIIVNKMDDHGRDFAVEQISDSISELVLENEGNIIIKEYGSPYNKLQQQGENNEKE